MFAILVQDPYNLSREEIFDLDDFWLFYIYFHPKDKFGAVKIRPKGPAAQKFSSREQYWADKRKWLWPDWYIQQEWDEHERRRIEERKARRERQTAKQQKKKGK